MRFLWILLPFFLATEAWCQVNGYAKVTSISGTTLTLSNVNETFDSFVAGENAILMQMQDDVIGDVSDASTFGDIGSIQSAGLYEIVALSSFTASSLQTLYQQNFDVNGLTFDNGSNTWSMTNNPGTSVSAQTANTRFEAAHGSPNNQDNTVIWYSDTLDISSYINLSISLGIGENGGSQSTDYVRVEYILDGVATQFDYQIGNFTSATSTVSGLNGSTLALRVTLFNDDNNETHYLDNVLIQGTSPATATLTASTSNSYNTGSNASLQLITYPTLDDGGGGNYTTTSDILAVDWDGNVGGVIAFKVTGTLTLLHNINADGAGFNGASWIGDGNSLGCSDTPYRTTTGDYYANKGEGIYKSTDANYAAARGKILNGGGGGNSHNAGGAGGGNYSKGGDGGPGWPNCTPSAGGLGGIALSSYISSSRIFMGGGGGAGEGNNFYPGAGGNGGGIILLAASTLETTAGCSGVSISANGDNSPDPGGNDGAGGAGGGGTIVLQIPNYNVNASCQLTVEANGGDGGNVDDKGTGTHGGGGGGGMGVVIYSIPVPSTNIVTNTDPGIGGDNDSSGSSSAPPGGGTPGSGGGIVDNSNTPLPVELIDFKGRSEGKQVILDWITATELNNDNFEVQMSRDGQGFVTVGKVDGRGTTREIQYYSFSHFNPYNGITYYRLKQVDFDGSYEYSKIIYVDHTRSFEPWQVHVYPNPVTNKVLHLKIVTDQDTNVFLTLNNFQGNLVGSYEFDQHQLANGISIDGSLFPSGIYFLSVRQGGLHSVIKVILP